MTITITTEYLRGVLSPLEKVMRVDMQATAFNADRMIREGKYLVDLACGHKACVTMRRKRVRCVRCTEMFRRSIFDGSADWEAFRNRGHSDRMIWMEDPCRQFNEPTDMSGNFVNEGPPSPIAAFLGDNEN